MIIYRPHRGGLKEAMQEAVEFESLEALLDYVVESHTDPDFGPAFGRDDIVLGDETKNDSRIGWRDTRYVCTRKYHSESYDPPAPIGFYATDYN